MHVIISIILIFIIWIVSIIYFVRYYLKLERKKIGSKMHNEIANDLVLFSMKLKNPSWHDSKNGHAELNNEFEKLSQTIRSWSHQLYENKTNSPEINVLLLIKKISNNIIKPLDSCEIIINYNCEPSFVFSNKHVKSVLPEIIKESLTNALKHSKAKKVFIDTWKENSILFLQIEDDGIGIAKDTSTHSGLGLKSLNKIIKKNQWTDRY